MEHVDVWRIHWDRLTDLSADSLCEYERCRLAKISDLAQRRRFIAVREARRRILARSLGVLGAEVRWQEGRYGKPELAGYQGDLDCSLTHSGPMVLFAVSHGRKVGIDIEHMRPSKVVTALARRYFRANEAALVLKAATQQPVFA